VKSLWRLSIRGGLVLLVLLAVLPALALQFYDGAVQRRHLINDATMGALRAVTSMTEVQRRIADSTRLLLTTLAAMPEVRSRNAVACEALFASLLRQNPIYANILAVDQTGTLFASGLPHGQDEINLADRKHVRDALETGTVATGEFVVSRTALHPIFPFSLEFRDVNGAVAGVLIAAIKLDAYDEAFDQLRLPPGTTCNIVDYHGVRLYSRPAMPDNPPGNLLRPDVWDAISRADQEGVTLLPGADGVRRYYAFRKLRLHPDGPEYMSFVIGLPEKDVLAPSRLALMHNLVLLAAAAGLSLAVAWTLGGVVIARRLDRLADTAVRIGQGELSARTGLPYDDPGIGKVAKSLDGMARLLARHDAAREGALTALHQSQERLAHIAASMADWIWETDAEDRYIYVSDKVTEVLGWQPEELIGKTPFALMVPGDAAVVEPIYAAAKAGRRPLRDLPNWCVAKDGRQRCMQTNGVPWHDATGRFRGYRGVDKDVTEQMEAERAIRASLTEKEILLKEIHHRVKNNLQIISSLLYLQEEQVHDPAALESFRESRNRIASMALVHEEIYRSADLSSIRLDTYITDLLPRLFGQTPFATPRLTFDCQLDPVSVPIEQAVPAGLIVNELLTNAYKHAFRGRDTGTLSILLQGGEQEVVIVIRDDGPGLPEGFDSERTGTLGMQLVVNLARQLGGTITTATDAGAVFTLRFPV